MKKTKIVMGMVANIEIAEKVHDLSIFDKVFDYFDYVDNKFSTYKKDSEISLINSGLVNEKDYSDDIKLIFKLSEETKNQTNGYFNIKNKKGKIDPSGIVKGWSIHQASLILRKAGYNNFYIELAGDIETSGLNEEGKPWKIGILNPLKPNEEIIKVVLLSDKGLATSGTYARGQHIYNPYEKDSKVSSILSLSIIGPNIYEADRFATAAFAMGYEGINFIEKLEDFEGYMVDKKGVATFTSNFMKYTKND